ncbi:unnamed protein product [Peronospora farinosa]|uniref:Reverse transcriptase Ty1/copia-type domain-containing protein n=1 Tax=Peronospora farinosa TaxID=134698 RepID=A0ABN8CJS1_9STRA|nr:unnamed protein product [Peronospora farinosa]
MFDRAATTDDLHKTTPVSEGESSSEQLTSIQQLYKISDVQAATTTMTTRKVNQLTTSHLPSAKLIVHKRGAQLPMEDFELPASLLLDVTSVFGAAMMALHISDGVPDPQHIREAMASPFWPQLNEAMIRELDQLCKNSTWKEAVPPPGAKVVSTIWICEIKYNSMGELDKFKARLVA